MSAVRMSVSLPKIQQLCGNFERLKIWEHVPSENDGEHARDATLPERYPWPF